MGGEVKKKKERTNTCWGERMYIYSRHSSIPSLTYEFILFASNKKNAVVGTCMSNNAEGRIKFNT